MTKQPSIHGVVGDFNKKKLKDNRKAGRISCLSVKAYSSVFKVSRYFRQM